MKTEYDLECLDDNDFNSWFLFYFHCKIWSRNKSEFIYITYESTDKEQVVNEFKDNCQDEEMGLDKNCWIISIRKGKRVYPEIHEKVVKFNLNKENI